MRCYVWREYYAICDGCKGGGPSTGLPMAETRRDAYHVAYRHGWRTVKGRFLCPGCQAKGETER